MWNHFWFQNHRFGSTWLNDCAGSVVNNKADLQIYFQSEIHSINEKIEKYGFCHKVKDNSLFVKYILRGTKEPLYKTMVLVPRE